MEIKDAIVQLLLKQPFYGYIAASITPQESGDTENVRMITDPVLKLLYNREWYGGLSEKQGVGVILHEILHLIFLHPYRKGNRERHLWTIACDMAVNEYIDRALLPGDAITVEKISNEIKEEIPRIKDAEAYYEIINKSDSRLSFAVKDEKITIALRGGDELNANNTMEADSSEIKQNAFKSMFSQILDQAGAEGEIPQGVSVIVGELYGSGEVNWRNVLKRFLLGKGKIQMRKTMKKESRRYENLPGSKRTLGLSALLALDESGSISNDLSSRFFSEMLSIKRITGTSLLVTEFDTDCTEPLPVERYIKEKRRVKNGGTDFNPVFALADRMRIPLVIIFTDGDGKAPEHVDQKVLWVLTKGGRKPAEYGHSVTFQD